MTKVTLVILQWSFLVGGAILHSRQETLTYWPGLLYLLSIVCGVLAL